MNITDLIKVIPKLFLFFIPGYIALEIYIDNRQTHKPDEKHMIVKSLIWSFVIKLIFDLTISPFNPNFISEKGMAYDFWLIAAALVAGILVSKYPDLKWVRWIKKDILKISTEPYSMVWNAALDCPEGAWCYVYCDTRDIVYLGQLRLYSSNPNYSHRELLLSNFKCYKISDSEVLSDNSADNGALVYINANDVTRIELFKS